MTIKARHTTHLQINAYQNTCDTPATNHYSIWQSHHHHWFHSLPFQQFQALLTLFSKSFSPFPHGTCLLSVLNQYLAWDEIYHQICAPIPRNVTLRTYTVHGGLQTRTGISPSMMLFSKRLTSAPPLAIHLEVTIQDHRPKFPYWANPCSFAITEGIRFSFSSSAYLYA